MQPDGQLSDRAFETTFIRSLNFETQPFVYNKNTQVMVSYDDASSFSMSNRYCLPFCRTHSPKQPPKASISSPQVLQGFLCGKLVGIRMISCLMRSTPLSVTRIIRPSLNRSYPSFYDSITWYPSYQRCTIVTFLKPIFFCLFALNF